MHVAVHYHGSDAGAAETCAAIEGAGGSASAHRADLYRREEVLGLADAVLAEADLDLLVPSAANFDRVAFDAIEADHIRRAFTLNFEAPLLLAQRCAPALRRTRGAIVLITDAGLTRPPRDYAPYLASKAAVQRLTQILAIELAPDVRVNAVAPGTVLPPPDMGDDEVAELVAHIPLGRVGTAEDVARAVVHLATSDFVTGQELVVDGGHRVGG
jgi:pteridine reductase